MDRQVEMDAPQISTLRDEETPPPQPKSSAARRAKTANNKTAQTWPRPRPKERQADEEYDDDDEDQQDQLIDDEDDVMKPPAAHPRSGESVLKKKTPSKRKRKTEKKVTEDEKKSAEKATANGVLGPAPDLAPTIGWFKAAPSEGQEDSRRADVDQIEDGESKPSSQLATPTSKPPREATTSRSKKTPKQKTALPILADDTGVASESYAGTAASSPITGHLEPNSPEPDIGASAEPAPLIEETNINLENVPLPIYPLPTKPFPVQPPPKIATGFAPAASLDKNCKKVRHWRIAQREIRGIAGGRWFARSWVGDKDSEYAVAVSAAKNADEKAPAARLVGSSISAPVGKGGGKRKTASSLAVSVAPSRSGSSIPDAPPASTMRAPTKMRTTIGPPSEDGESDATAVLKS